MIVLPKHRVPAAPIRCRKIDFEKVKDNCCTNKCDHFCLPCKVIITYISYLHLNQHACHRYCVNDSKVNAVTENKPSLLEFLLLHLTPPQSQYTCLSISYTSHPILRISCLSSGSRQPVPLGGLSFAVPVDFPAL